MRWSWRSPTPRTPSTWRSSSSKRAPTRAFETSRLARRWRRGRRFATSSSACCRASAGCALLRTPSRSARTRSPPRRPRAIRLLYTALTRAVTAGATELRFDPRNHDIRVTQRINGLLLDVGAADLKLHSALLARARILAGAPAGSRGPLDPVLLQSIVADVPVRLEVTVFEGDRRGAAVRITITRGHVPQLLHDFALSEEATRLLTAAEPPRGLLLVCSSCAEVATGLALAAGAEARPLERYVVTLGDQPLGNVEDFRHADELRQVLAARPDVLITGHPRIDTATDLAECASRMWVLAVSPEPDAASAVRRWVDMGVRRSTLARVLTGVVCAAPEAPFTVQAASLDVLGSISSANIFSKVDFPSVDTYNGKFFSSFQLSQKGLSTS